MKKQLFQRILCWLLVLCMVLPGVPVTHAAHDHAGETNLQLTPYRTDLRVPEEKQEEPDPQERVRVSIVLEAPSTVEAGFATMGIAGNTDAMAYRARLKQSQEQMEKTISAQVLGGEPLEVAWNMTLVGNIISAWVPYGRIDAIKALSGVRTVELEQQFEPCVTERSEGIAPQVYGSSAMTGSSLLWSNGYTGAGSRIAIIDTGTDTEHQSFDNDAYLYALEQNAAEKGMSLNAYMESLNLLTEEEIARVLPELNVSSLSYYVDADDLYVSEKLPFGFNYVDRNLTIDHDYDMEGEHGSHVAGIATANRFIPDGSGYDDARDTVKVLGVAPDAQLITMKVFGQNTLYDSDYMAAIEDAIVLGCDSVNLSLGTANPGTPHNYVYKELLDLLEQTDTIVSISAGNAYDWAVYTAYGHLYHEDVSLDTVGEPGSYTNALTVASVENAGVAGECFEIGGRNFVYVENLGFGNAPMADLDLTGTGTIYDYVFLDGMGYPNEYNGIDVANKIVMISRGELNFVDKANTALNRGAVAVVIYNNDNGILNMDVSGLDAYAPVVSISRSDAAAIRAISQDRGTYLSGQVTVSGKNGVSTGGADYYYMSEFSSWGVPGDLSLKPEITAPGGEIYSVWGSNRVSGGGYDQYETMSGTSMAAPQVAGMAALMAQVYRENGLAEKSGISARHLAQSLLMSTAQPLYEEESGNYYSLLKQGAGLARVDLAARAESFVLVQGQEDGKAKAELGDDPNRTGVYSFTFTIHNLTNRPAAYTLDADLFRQNVIESYEGSGVMLMDQQTTGLNANVTFTSSAMNAGGGTGRDLNGDGSITAADADFLLEYLLGNEPRLYDNGDIDGDGTVNSYDAHLLLASLSGDVLNVPANSSAEVTVRMALTDAAKAELDAEMPKGTYVQAYVYARAVADAEGNVGVTHSIPVLAFYGSWTDPSMFDCATRMEMEYEINEHEPYVYEDLGNDINFLTVDYGDGYLYYFGDNPYVYDSEYLPERAAMSSTNNTRLYSQHFTLIRGAADTRLEITDADTGEVYFQRQNGACYPAYFNINYGWWLDTDASVDIGWSGTDAYGRPLPEGTRVDVSLIAVPYYYQREDGSVSYENLGEGSRLTTTVTIDNTAPETISVDDSRINEGKLTVRVQDNAYVAAVALIDAQDGSVIAAKSPNQTRRGEAVDVELRFDDLNGYGFEIVVYDYACNMSTHQLGSGSSAVDYVDSLEISHSSIQLMKGNSMKLEATVLPWNASDRTVSWSTSDSTVATVDGQGLVTCRGSGSCTVTATSNLDPSFSASCTVTCLEVDQSLHAVLWDEYSDTWMVKFDTATLPSYTKLHSDPLDLTVASATMGQDGRIYIASMGSYMESDLYWLDPQTYQINWIGSSFDGYMDMAPAPGMGEDTLMAINGNSLMLVDTNTGAYYDWFTLFEDYLVGIAYIGTEPYNDGYVDTMIDWYFLITQNGTVYLLGFLSDNGTYYYMEHDELAPGGVYTQLDFEIENSFYNCAYFDGEMLYFTSFQESMSQEALVAVDVAGGTRNSYLLGDFGDYVWPVVGLMKPGTLGGDIGILGGGSQPIPIEEKFERKSIRQEVERLQTDKQEQVAEAAQPSYGGLHSVAAAPMSSGDARGEEVYVDITLPAAGTNAQLSVSFDRSMLELLNVSGSGTAFAWNDGDTVELAVAEYATMSADAQVARLTFRALRNGATDVIIDTYVLGREYVDLTEKLSLTLDLSGPHEHSYTGEVTNPTCTERGYTTYTCSCGASYTGDYTDPLGHDMGEWQVIQQPTEDANGIERSTCSRCGYYEERPYGNVASKREAFFSDEEWEVLKLVNQERLAQGLQPLTGFELLQKVGDIRVVELVELFSHTRPDGSDCFSAYDEVGVDYWSAGENIAAGYDDPYDVMDGWMNSPGHRSNILSSSFDSVGLGYHYQSNSGYTRYWTQNFRGMYGYFTDYQVVIPQNGQFDAGTSFGEMDIYLVLDYSEDDYDHYLPLTEEMVSITEGSGSMTVTFDVLGLTGTFTVNLGHSHSYTAVVTEPTCTEGGYTTYTCSCGSSYISDYTDPLGHDWSAWETIKEATCVEGGIEERICCRCNEVETVSTDATGHNWSDWDIIEEATCTEDGYEERVCFNCGAVETATLEATGHNWSDWDIIEEATCTEDGYEERVCFNCGAVETATLDATGHDWTDWEIVEEPSCTEDGHEERFCFNCDAVESNVLAAEGHDWTGWVVIEEPTISAPGLKSRMCLRCLYVDLEVIPELEHTHAYIPVVTEPTCTEQGYTTYTCECGDSYKADYVEALGHSMSDWLTVKAPTCTEPGTEQRSCSRCGYTETRQVDATGHSHTAVVTEPTCTEQGYTTYTCACGDSYKADYVEALGHSMGDWLTVKAPTCTEPGTEQRSCSRCGYTESRQVDATGHSYTAVVTEPTCTQAGFTTYTCGNCGHSYVSDYVDALGHNYVDGTCTRCGAKDPNYQEPAVNPFTDVPEGSFYYEPVLWAVENGITSGATATTFNPTGDCQRAQVVTFLWRAAGKPEPSSTVNPFVDVSETDFYYKAVLWAVEKGITNGVDATHFSPFAYCNRAQVVTFLYRAMGSPEVVSASCPFVDVVAGAWYEAPILWAVENGITNGMDATHFGVNVICNRAQVVTFLYRTLA